MKRLLPLAFVACTSDKGGDSTPLAEDGGAADTAPCVPVEWYVDSDADGYGAEVVVACEPPSGAVSEGGDCDDAESTVHPGAVERCNGVDDDCDSQVDDDDPDVVDALMVYADTDGDGWGDPLNTRLACAVGAGWLLDEGDCDDSDAAVNPAGVDACDDGLDQDCDGADAACPAAVGRSFDEAALTVWGWHEFQAIGHESHFVGDVLGAGRTVLAVASAYDETAGTGAGAVYLFDGTERGGVLASDAPVRIYGEDEWDHLGSSVHGPGDLDGDGVPDLLVTAVARPVADWEYAGVVYLLAGPLSGDVDLDDAMLTVSGVNYRAYAGYDLDGGEDLTGDGQADFAVVSYVYPEGKGGVGRVSIFSVGDSTALDTGSPAIVALNAESFSTYFAAAIEAGADLDGDGFVDIAVGEPGLDSDGMSNTGAVHVFSGPFDAQRTSDDADSFIVGAPPGGSSLGTHLSAGDVDSDGQADLLVGGDSPGEQGAAWLFEGPLPTGAWDDHLALASFSCHPSECESPGTGVSAGGDLDGDGIGDLAIGGALETDRRQYQAAVFVGFGPIEGAFDVVHDLPIIAAAPGATFSSGATGSVDSSQDVDGDGTADLLAGNAGDTSAGVSSGVAWLVLGGW